MTLDFIVKIIRMIRTFWFNYTLGGIANDRDAEIDEQLTRARLDGLLRFYAKSSRLSVIPSLMFSITTLTVVDVSDNYIVVVPVAFSQLVNLTALDLSHNSIQTLPCSIFRLLCKLEQLLLHCNRLTSLPPTISKLQLQHMTLSSNPVFERVYTYRDEIPETPSVALYMRAIKERFTFDGAQAAALTVILICKYIPAPFRDVFRFILAPMIWASRDDDEWRDADEAAYQRKIKK